MDGEMRKISITIKIVFVITTFDGCVYDQPMRKWNIQSC